MKPGLIAVRLLPLTDLPKETEEHSDGVLISQFELTVDTSRPAEFSTTVEIQLEGETRTPDAVAVYGRVAAPIELSPSFLVLPRSSGEGPIYYALCTCRGTNGLPVSLAVESAPDGLTAEVAAGEEPAVRTVRIAQDPRRMPSSSEGERRLVRFRARAGNDEQTLELPVFLRR